MGLKLYELSAMMQAAIDAAVDRETGEIGDDWAKFLDDVTMERDAKALDCARYIKSLLAEAEAIRAEEKALADRRHGLESRAESIKRYIVNNIQVGQKLSDATAAISWRKSQHVEIVDLYTLPADFIEIKREPKKAEIKQAINSGENVPGIRIIKTVNLQIK